MRSIIGNKMATLYNFQNKAQYIGFFTRTYKRKTQYRLTVPFVKVSIVYCFKNFVWVENFPQ